MRQAADLACIDGAVDVQHILSGHAHRLRDHRSLIGAVARMATAEVIGHAPSDAVKFNPAADAIAVCRSFGLLERQHF